MSYQCEVKEVAHQPTLVIRRTVPIEDLGKMLGQAFGSIAQYLGELGKRPTGPPYAAYYNDDMQNLEVEAGFPVARELPGGDDVQAGEIPGGRAATCLHTGPYSEIEAAYTAISQWMEEQGYEPTGVVYEIYLNDPEEISAEGLRTQILFPLRS